MALTHDRTWKWIVIYRVSCLVLAQVWCAFFICNHHLSTQKVWRNLRGCGVEVIDPSALEHEGEYGKHASLCHVLSLSPPWLRGLRVRYDAQNSPDIAHVCCTWTAKITVELLFQPWSLTARGSIWIRLLCRVVISDWTLDARQFLHTNHYVFSPTFMGFTRKQRLCLTEC